MKLIYIMDPLCGWCYGNSKNTLAVYEKYKHVLDMEIIPGGMWAGNNVRKQSPQMAAYFKKHDMQIAKLTGAEFGNGYFDFIEQASVMLDSEIPSRAIVTVQAIWPDKQVLFTIEVQKARYLFGKDLNDDEVYIDICAHLGIDEHEFLSHFHSAEIKELTQKAFERSVLYASSYPTLLLDNDGRIALIEQGYSTFTQISDLIEQHLTTITE